MKIDSDIDIDFGSRDELLKLIPHTPAAMRNAKPIRKHATGVYVTDIPYDPVNDMAAIDYVIAEKRGYFKLDLLNVHVYSQVQDEKHLVELMADPDWSKLNDREFVEKLIHLGNHYQSIQKMPEPINSIPRLAMFLALIRPAKRHLIGKSWKEVSMTIWDKGDDGYHFKKSHSLAYSHLVVVHMNLLTKSVSQG
jgi:glycosyltransferase involved in cell wall biosynthesis